MAWIDLEKHGFGPNSRWTIVLSAVAFSAWCLARSDPWGSGFGALIAYHFAVKPLTPREEEVRWRIYARRVGTVAFAVLAVLAIWRSLLRP